MLATATAAALATTITAKLNDGEGAQVVKEPNVKAHWQTVALLGRGYQHVNELRRRSVFHGLARQPQKMGLSDEICSPLRTTPFSSRILTFRISPKDSLMNREFFSGLFAHC